MAKLGRPKLIELLRLWLFVISGFDVIVLLRSLGEELSDVRATHPQARSGRTASLR